MLKHAHFPHDGKSAARLVTVAIQWYTMNNIKNKSNISFFLWPKHLFCFGS